MASGSSSTRRPDACEGAGAARPLCTLVLLSALVSLTVLTTAPAADAATRRATDSATHIRFTLDNRILTVRLLRGTTRRVRRQLYGRRIQATCGTAFPHDLGVRVSRTRIWPAGRRRVRFRFRRNISRRAKWCQLERSGNDVAGVSFTG